MKHTALVFLFLMSCASSDTLTPEQQAYHDFCMQHHGAWMKMSEINDGVPTGKTCYGCMPDEKNHLCTQEEYEAFTA